VDHSVAALGLLAGCILLVLLFVFGMTGDAVVPEDRRIIAVQPGQVASPSATAPAGVVGSVSQASTSGRRFGEGLSLFSRGGSGLTGGFVIGPGSSPLVLSAARLRVGDVLTDVDGRPLDQTRIASLGDELETLDRLEFTFERDGQVRNRTIELRR
jgi:hypothetical protein